MKYYLIAGEASGDLHASNLMVALKQQDAAAEFRFFGGDLMQAVGGTLGSSRCCFMHVPFFGTFGTVRRIYEPINPIG